MCARGQTLAVDGVQAQLLALSPADRPLSQNFRNPMKESAHVHTCTVRTTLVMRKGRFGRRLVQV